MARKNNSRKAQVAPYQGYIPVYINDKEKKAIGDNPGSAEARCNKFIKMVEAGFRLTITWDEYNECYSASLYDTDARRPSGGYILAGKHVEFDRALDILIWLHEVKYADGWDIENAGHQGDVSW